MYQALLAIAPALIFVFAVHRWASDELGRHGALSEGAARAITFAFLLHAMLVTLAATGGVGQVDAPAPAAVISGAAIGVPGAVLAALAASALGSLQRAWRVGPLELVTSGVYRAAHHPLYLGWTAMLLGVAVAGRSILALLFVLPLAAVLWRMALSDERDLHERFGAVYESYRAAVPRWIGAPADVPAPLPGAPQRRERVTPVDQRAP